MKVLIITPWYPDDRSPSSGIFIRQQAKALARKGPFADANADGVVDASDYALLRKTAVAGGTDAATGASLADWRAQFGETMPDLSAMDAAISAAAGSSLNTSSVPEPACWLMLVIATAVSSSWRRSRR